MARLALLIAAPLILVGTTADIAVADGTTPPVQFVRLHKLENFPIAQPMGDGGQPVAGVVQGSDGLFYGTATCGGGTAACPNGGGTVFRLSGDGSTFEVLHAFSGGDDGGNPYAPLIQANDGFFYGTTNCGGGSTNCFNNDPLTIGHGTIFRVSLSGSFETVYAFSGSLDGTAPYSALVQGRDGNLYGTTFCGGGGINCLDPASPVGGGGTIFRFNPTTRAFATLHTFTDSDVAGCFSLSGLVEDKTATGVFYGTMPWCGSIGSGTVFKIDSSKSARNNVTALHAFTGAADGAGPSAPLIIGTDGNLYGAAEFAGLTDGSGYGTIFKLSTSGTGFATLYTFTGRSDGGNPYAGLLQGHDGDLYGTTFYRSIQINQTGTLFRIDPGTQQFETLYMFTGGFDGQNPSGGLVQIGESLASGFTGSLVGTTLFGPTVFAANGSVSSYGNGVIFRFAPPPLLVCPAPVVTTATSTSGASVVLNATLIDPANTATTLTWSIDGALAQTDFIPAASSLSNSTRTTKAMTKTYTAGKAGTTESRHTVSIESIDTIGLTSSCLVTVEVDKRNQTINFTTVPTQTYSDPNGSVTLNAASVSGTTPTNLPVTFNVTSGPGFLSSSNVLTITGAGSIVVTASQGGNGEYNPATDVSQTITVNKAGQTITFAAIANQTFANPPPALSLTPSSSSGLAVTLTVTGPATLSQTAPSSYTLALTGAGTVAVTASQPGDSNYNAATNVVRTFTVAKGSQTITFPTVPAQTFGNPPVTLAATASSGLAVSYSATGPGTISGNVLTITGAGTIAVTASQPGNANFNAASSVSQNIVVAKANQTITFTAVSPQPVFGNPPVTLSATASSGLGVTYAVVSGSGTISGNVLTITGAGSITVSASQAGSANYNAATTQQTITVLKADQTITFPALPTALAFGNPPITLNATASSGLPVSYVVSGPAAVSGSVLTISGTGTITVTATQGGSANYNSVVSLPQSIVVSPGNQTINFPPVATQFVGYPPVTLTATASSGLPVSYSASGPGAIAGSVLTITGAGTIVVTASQGGDSNYNAAAPVQQNVTVLDPSQSPLTRFVVFSTDLTWLHSGTIVASGDVGANTQQSDDDNDHDNDDVTVRLDNGVTMQQASSRVVGDTVRLGPGSAIYNLVDNALISHNSTILGVRVDTMALPYLTMPAVPAIAAGTQSITVKKNTTLTLAAGGYGRVEVENGATLKLTGGLYQFVSLDVDESATVVFQAPVQLRIQTYLDADTRSNLILDPAAAGLRASQVVIYVAGSNNGSANDKHDSVDEGFGGPAVVNIGERAVVQANICAPNGSIWLKSRSQATGAFVGQHVLVGSFSKLTLDSAFF